MTVAINSILSYYQIRNTLGEKQKAVLELLRDRNLTNREMAHLLDWEINRLTPRTKELREKGLVYEYGRKYDRETSREVSVWALKDEYKGRQETFNF